MTADREIDLQISGVTHATILDQHDYPMRCAARRGDEAIEIRLFGPLEGEDRRQIESLSTLPRHPNLERPFRHGVRRDGVVHLEFAPPPATRLADELADGPLVWDDAAAVLEQLGTALAVLHDHGVVHGDIGPSTIRVKASGALLCDAGMWARVSGHASTQTVAGRLPYSAPELFDGAPPSRASDLYALAAVAHHLLTGLPPYATLRDGPLQAIGRMIHGPVPTVTAPGVPAPAVEAISACLAIDPPSRLTDAMAFVDAIVGQRFLRSAAPTPAPANPPTDTSPAPSPDAVAPSDQPADPPGTEPTPSTTETAPSQSPVLPEQDGTTDHLFGEHSIEEADCDAAVIGSITYSLTQRLQSDATMSVLGSDLSIWVYSPGGYDVQQVSVPELQHATHGFGEAIDAAVAFAGGCLVFTARWLEFITDQGNRTWKVPRERRRPDEVAVVGDHVWALQLSRRRVGRNTATRVQLVTELRSGYRSETTAERLHTVAGRLVAEEGGRLIELDPERAHDIRRLASAGWERGPLLRLGPRAAWSPQVVPRKARRMALLRLMLDGSGDRQWCDPMVSMVAESRAPQPVAIAPDPDGCFFRAGQDCYWADNVSTVLRRVVGVGDRPFADSQTRLIASPRGALMLSHDGLLHRLVPPTPAAPTS